MTQNPARARHRITGPLELVPEIVLPEQVGGDLAMSPEHRLMRSILEDAMSCLDLAASMSGILGQVARRAELRGGLDMAWIEANDMDHPFSFLRICEELEYPVTETRRFARAVFAGTARYARVNRVSGTRTRLGGRSEE